MPNPRRTPSASGSVTFNGSDHTSTGAVRRSAVYAGASAGGRTGSRPIEVNYGEPTTGSIRTGSTTGRPPAGRPGAPQRVAPRPHTRRRDPLWARLLIIMGAVLMVVSGGAIVGGKALLYQATGSVEKAPLLGDAGIANGAAALKGALNILMVGIDERPDSTELVRADSILILHIPEDRSGAYLVSLPRDSLVDIPAYPKGKYSGGKEKINGAFAHGWANGGGRAGGFELLALTVQRLTGLSFNAGAIIDFKGFEAVVNALGGVNMCVDTKKPVTSEHVGFDSKGNYLHPRDGGKPMVYHPGECRKFKGWEALDYVRQRKSLEDGDYGRARHQQQFVKALAKEAKSQNFATNPKKMYDVIQSVGKALTVDLRGASIEDWLFTVKDLADSDVVMLKVNGGRFNSVQCGGEACEGLSSDTMDMFKAFDEDKMAEFVIQHPEFVSS